MTIHKTKPILSVLRKEKPSRIPFWMMRQAGRYLPEYRAIRSKTKNFLEMVYTPEKATEITIQPLRRFGMDAAILFSDILVVPDALGQHVDFKAGEGPKLTPLSQARDFLSLDPSRIEAHCTPVYETVTRVSEGLRAEGFDESTLIGFCGCPWTVACYMIEGGGSRDFEKPRLWSYQKPQEFQHLIDLLIEASILYLSGQIKAGAEVIQLFDSWAGLLDEEGFHRWVIDPTKRIVDAIKAKFPHIPIIGFPRGAGAQSVAYANNTGIEAIGLDYTIPARWAAGNIPNHVILQGNLDPLRLLVGGAEMEGAMEDVYQAFSSRPFIFNLGHGVIKETPVEHVHQLTKIVRGWAV